MKYSSSEHILRMDDLNMNHFNSKDIELYCQIFNINPDDIKALNLSWNKLTDINGLIVFKNLETLDLYDNLITDINILQNFTNLKRLDLSKNPLNENQTVKILKKLVNLEELSCKNIFNKIDIKKILKKVTVLA